MLYFLSVTALLYSERIVRLRGVATAGVLFVGLFFLIAAVMGKGDNDGVDSLLGSVVWNSQVYLLSSVACFNDFVVTDSQRMVGGALLPNSLRDLLALGGISIPEKPSLLPFSEVPVPCNTYTFMFPLFHDGSFPGLAVGCFAIGFVHQHMYLKFAAGGSPNWSYLYAISLYALAMSIFEDAYFSSPGFWVVLLVPPVALYISRRLALTFGMPHIDKNPNLDGVLAPINFDNQRK
jgi:oligosaccharide repeat unit polymerase